jgi:hypothetical protein
MVQAKNSLTRPKLASDEARRIAANVARPPLPTYNSNH